MNVFLYLLVAFALWVVIYRLLYLHHQREFPMLEWENFDRFFGVVWGGVVALAWPLTVTIAILAAIVWYVVIPVAKPFFDFLEK